MGIYQESSERDTRNPARIELSSATQIDEVRRVAPEHGASESGILYHSILD